MLTCYDTYDVARCTICQQHAHSQQKEPLLQKGIPPYPWHTLSADFFELEGHEYLLIVDHYSKFSIVHQRVRQTMVVRSHNLIAEVCAIKWICRTHGADREEHLRKAKMDDLDPDLALLCLRSTPISKKIISPLELLMSRKGKANLTVSMHNQLPDAEQIGAAFRDRQDLQRRNYNLRAGAELPQLYAGQHVRFQQQPSSKWTPARIVREAAEPRSYLLETSDGSVLRRSRHHIAETPLPVAELQRQPKRVRFLDDVMSAPAEAQLVATPAPAVTTEPIAERRD